MSIALVMVEKTFAGQSWVNTHAVQIGAANTGMPADADLDAIGVNAVFSAALTSGGAGTTFLQRLVNFERLLHYPPVTISKVYVTDGKKNKINPGNEFAVIPLQLAGLQSTSGATGSDWIAPGNISLLLNRVPIGYSVKPGRAFYRACIAQSQVHFSGNKLVDFVSSAVATAIGTTVSSAVSASGLGGHMGTSGGTGTYTATAFYCIPHYTKGDTTVGPTNTNGQLATVTPVSNIILKGVTARQGNRGRKKKKA